MKQHHALFANFILRFGDKELIDYAESILIPALTHEGQVRKYGKRTEYFIYKAELARLDDREGVPAMAVIGQFIKKTQLVRHQVFEADKGPVADEASLASAPSAFFVLMLSNHRLIYFPETPDSPDLTSFKATVKRFIGDRYKEYIDDLHREGQQRDEPTTKTALRKLHKSPTLEIIPLTGADSISAFVNRYKVLKSIEFRIVKPNSEIDGHAIFKQIRQLSDDLESHDTRLRTTNSDGLDKDASKQKISEATAQGNQEVTLDGIDHEGNKLKGNNDEFKISAPIGKPPAVKLSLAKRLYQAFSALTANGTIKIDTPHPRVIDAMNGMAE
jgi:hypothetical protein